MYHTRTSLTRDLQTLGVRPGDAVFVHASLRPVGSVVGGARSVVEALLDAVRPDGAVAMPGFSSDAYLPDWASSLPDAERAEVAAAVPGFDAARSGTDRMGVLAEMFRSWPGTQRSDHPSTSVCVNGADAERLVAQHSLAFATGVETPFGALYARPGAKILLIGVGWNRCTALHMGETLAEPRRLKSRHVKREGAWVDVPDVADDLGRLFPACGEAFEATGAVSRGRLGAAEARLCGFRALVEFSAAWIGAANAASRDRA
ncbi:MAG: AAC(3) family N-acetyltransferase [Pseudomonadota bacterium]